MSLARNEILTIRLRAHEHDLIQRAAADARQLVSEWARIRLIHSAEQQLPEIRPPKRTRKK